MTSDGIQLRPSGTGGGGLRTLECDVDATWIDINDHMNAQYYGIVIYRAHAAFTDVLGLGDEYVRKTRFGKVVVQTAMTYEREVRRGARLAVDSWLLGVDAKRLHFFHEVRNLGGQTRVAVGEQLDLHVDLETRRTTPMPADLFTRLQRFAAGQCAAGRPEGVGRTIIVPRT
ncbi:thioesterase family protein [Nocardia aurantiaca]|uniref:Thioesterase-like protein n=1 Tax=Nocardia aurantiaca TaxID=2675850 RepID=A0A6I3KTJ6_9NOCA|nr:thioesterase family protein [Nocardia aurantiaca]MTE14113.1 thioesterase-like protein [Nocardia aurantiaca]